ncbi:MAG TPA: hypothetical protein VMB75_01405, partial [Rhodocyclaceae bacterium]|nr:hypothetical protein [Rhodocyclaceae bacterium]
AGAAGGVTLGAAAAGLPVLVVGITAAAGIGLATVIALHVADKLQYLRPEAPGHVTGGRTRGHPIHPKVALSYGGSGAALPGQSADLFSVMTSASGAINAELAKIGGAIWKGGLTPEKLHALYQDTAALQKLAGQPILLGNISAKHSPEQLLEIRNQLVSSLGVTKAEANRIMHMFFKDWNPRRDLSPKVVAAERLLQSKIAVFHKLGLDLTSGLAQGVTDGAPWAIRAVRMLSTGSKSMQAYVEADLRSHSPSLVFEEIGQNMMAGWAQGINKGKGAVYAAVNQMVHRLMNAAGWAGGSRSDIGGPYPAGGGSAAANVNLGRKMAAAYGWTGAEFEALYRLWSRESGWRTTATNPTSGAYGIPQALPASKMASAGRDWRTNPATQIAWGLGYIRGGGPDGSFHDPIGALAHENRLGWYDRGGYLPTGWSTVLNTTGRPEPVGRAISDSSGLTIEFHNCDFSGSPKEEWVAALFDQFEARAEAKRRRAASLSPRAPR